MLDPGGHRAVAAHEGDGVEKPTAHLRGDATLDLRDFEGPCPRAPAPALSFFRQIRRTDEQAGRAGEGGLDPCDDHAQVSLIDLDGISAAAAFVRAVGKNEEVW